MSSVTGGTQLRQLLLRFNGFSLRLELPLDFLTLLLHLAGAKAVPTGDPHGLSLNTEGELTPQLEPYTQGWLTKGNRGMVPRTDTQILSGELVWVADNI